MMPDEVKEAKMVNEFRVLVDDNEVEDAELRRFLRARNYDFKQAGEMFRQSRIWRKSVRFDEALDWDIPEVISKNFPFYCDGLDKDGRLALYFPIGRWEVRKMITAGWKEEMERNIYSVLAKIVHSLDASKSEQFVIVVDLAELTYWKVAHFETVQMVLQVFRMYEQYFPERLKDAVVINAPWAMNCIFPLVKPLLTGKTMQKVQIFDSTSEKYVPVILDRIPKNSMPSRLMENLGQTIHL